MAAVNQLDGNRRYKELTDEEVLLLIRSGEGDALDFLIQKYERVVRYKARTYFLIGSDRDDVVQEGLIGLYKAICDYDESKLASFRGFADLCITRQIITSVKTATRLKHTPLNSYISIYKPVHEEESDRILQDVIVSCEAEDPQEFLINKERLQNVYRHLNKKLTTLEMEVLPLYLQGCSYVEIAESLGRHEKSIDNALQRVKRKISRLVETKELVY